MIAWARVLGNPRKRTFTPEQKQAAIRWDTCAVGEASRKHPNLEILLWDAPVYDALATLGVAFERAVLRDSVPTARRVYQRIQRRVAVLEGRARRSR